MIATTKYIHYITEKRKNYNCTLFYAGDMQKIRCRWRVYAVLHLASVVEKFLIIIN